MKVSHARTANDEVILRRDMSMSHADFHRIFPKVVGDAIWRTEGDVVTLNEGEGRVLRIKLGVEGERRIANLALPRTLVEFCFDGYSDAHVEAFLQRFDRSFRRGGG